jgi:peptidoglycan-N-acetylglucosamine deacetylase
MTASFCITLDCDSLTSHHAVWGLPPPDAGEVESFFLRALDVADDWLGARGLPATLFVTGGDATPAVLARLVRLAGAGHEVGNHTFSHPYDLTNLDADTVSLELERNHRLLADAGLPCRGYRAPGYHLSPAALATITRLDYAYSSSQITGWVYPTAKWATALGLRLRGRRTRTVRHPISDWWTPKAPYHPDPSAPHRPGSSPLWELPIAAGRFGLPSVGALIHAGLPAFLFDTPGDRPWILNLHLTDFAPDEPRLPLAGPDFTLRVPLERRLGTLDRILARATGQGRPVRTLAALAASLD